MEGVEKEGEVPEGLSRELCAEEMGKKLEILAKAAKEKEETAGKAEECGEWRGGGDVQCGDCWTSGMRDWRSACRFLISRKKNSIESWS